MIFTFIERHFEQLLGQASGLCKKGVHLRNCHLNEENNILQCIPMGKSAIEMYGLWQFGPKVPRIVLIKIKLEWT